MLMGITVLSRELFAKDRDHFGRYYCNGQINPFRLEGKRIYVHEICVQLGWEVPSVILVPVAGGNGVIAIGKGFRELKEIG
jgi:threonine synthase